MKTTLQKTILIATLFATSGWSRVNAQTLVKDIISGTGSSNPGLLTKINESTILFYADNGTNGMELWKTDGTDAGTVMVKDINVGASGSFVNFNKPFAYNGKMFFIADDGVAGKRVWVSDGTNAGTMMLKDVAIPTYNYFGAINNLVFFQGGGNLYVSDGTPSGTNLFNVANPTAPGVNPTAFKKAGNYLYYKAGSSGTALWRTDGTLAGTLSIMGNTGSNASYFSDCNDTLYLSASNGISGQEPYKSDGTISGTVLVKDVESGPGGSLTTSPLFTFSNNQIFFVAYTSANGTELWKTDGTSVGTSIVKNIKTGSSSSYPDKLFAFNNEIYFSADGGSGYKLWKSDGTDAGTVTVNTNATSPTAYIIYHDTLFISTGNKLWKSDGTILGTIEVPGSTVSSPADFTIMNDVLYFVAQTSTTGYELWKYGIPSLGLNILSEEDNFSIFPNPSTGKFTLQIINDEVQMMNPPAGRAGYEVKIYNILGEQIQHSVFSIQHSIFMDISKHSSGIYYVQIKEGDKIYNQKIIKE